MTTLQPQPQQVLLREEADGGGGGVVVGGSGGGARATLLYHLAHAYLLEEGESTRVAEAIDSATQAVELSPRTGKAWLILGLANERLGTAAGLDAAVRCYTRGAKVKKRHFWSTLYTNSDRFTKTGSGNIGKTQKKSAVFLQEEPGAVGNWHNLALLLGRAERWEGSLAAAEGALAAVPGHAAGWVARGNAQRKLGHLLRALQSYRTAGEVAPRHVAAWHNMGVVLHELGRARESADALSRAGELEKQQP